MKIAEIETVEIEECLYSQIAVIVILDSNIRIIDLFLPCTIVTLVDNWLPSRLISSQLSRLRLLGISSERWGKYLVFSYSFESFLR